MKEKILERIARQIGHDKTSIGALREMFGFDDHTAWAIPGASGIRKLAKHTLFCTGSVGIGHLAVDVKRMICQRQIKVFQGMGELGITLADSSDKFIV